MPDLIDLSNNQSALVDFAKVAASGVAGVYHKATEGTSYVDPYWPRRKADAAAAGLKVGAYHFAHPGDPMAQARFFVNQGVVTSLPPVLDLEKPPGTQWASPQAAADFAVVFLSELEALTQIQPMLYTFSSFPLPNDPRLSRWPLWIANYGPPGGVVPPKPPWAGWSMWQFTDASSTPGVAVPCDRSYADPAWWASLTRPQPSTTTTTGVADVQDVRFIRVDGDPAVYLTNGAGGDPHHVASLPAQRYMIQNSPNTKLLPPPAGANTDAPGSPDVWVVKKGDWTP